MSINVTSRGKLYTFPSGTKYSVIDAFLKERFANGAFIDDRGVVYTDKSIKDGSYTVVLSQMATFEHEMLIFRMNSAIELRKHLENEEAARRKHLLRMRELDKAIRERLMNPQSFMKNLIRLSTCLMDDSGETCKNLDLAASWIDYSQVLLLVIESSNHFLPEQNIHNFVPQRADATPKQASFIIQEWVPKLITTLLSREYDWQRTSFSKVVSFLGKLYYFLAENLPVCGNCEAVQGALRDLCDRNQPFYTRYCVAQNEPLPPRLPDITNPDNRNWVGQKRTLDPSDHHRSLVAAPALKKTKTKSSSERLHVRFDLLDNLTFVYSPTSCPMEAPYLFAACADNSSEYFDLPVYCGRRWAGESKKKGCKVNNTEEGWVIVSRSDSITEEPSECVLVADV